MLEVPNPCQLKADDTSPQDPVAGSMAAASQLADLPLLLGILGCTGAQQFRHVLFSFPGRRFGHALMSTAFEERSTSTTSLITGEPLEKGLFERLVVDKCQFLGAILSLFDPNSRNIQRHFLLNWQFCRA